MIPPVSALVSSQPAAAAASSSHSHSAAATAHQQWAALDIEDGELGYDARIARLLHMFSQGDAVVKTALGNAVQGVRVCCFAFLLRARFGIA